MFNVYERASAVTVPDGARIRLTRGKCALVDEADYDDISRFVWCALLADGIWYAKRAILVEGRHQTILMHRAVVGAEFGRKVDHRNGNGLDNRRTNLRIATTVQNSQNMRSSPNQKRGGYKGVSRAEGGKWQVHIRVPNPNGGIGKRLYLGLYKDPEVAARVYDSAALVHHGAFAALNFGTRDE